MVWRRTQHVSECLYSLYGWLFLCRVDLTADELELKEVKEESVKVATKKHESALISEQSKLVDLQLLLETREEASQNVIVYT